MDDAELKASKAAMRRRVLAARDALDPVARLEASLALPDLLPRCAQLEALARDGRVIAGFHPIRSEIDPRPLMVRLADLGAILALPAVVDETTIVFRELVRTVPLEAGAFGTAQPPASAAELRPAALLVPLSAFDATGARLGYGGGFYDRAMERLARKGDLVSIGVAFADQQVQAVPTGTHDRRLSGVLTERGYVPAG